MVAQLLVSVLRVPSVGTLAPGASVTLAHGLKSNDAGVTPTLIEPGGATNIVVTAADATNVTFRNDDADAGSAQFRVYFDPSIVAEAPVAPLWWNGITGSTSPSGAAGGDLSGTYPDPTVAKIQGQPIVAGTPLTGADLEYSSGSWTPTFRYNSTITNLYVNNATGSDSNDGLTALTPKKTIQAGVNAAGTFLGTAVASGVTPHVTVNIAAQDTTEDVVLGGFEPVVGAKNSGYSITLQGAAQTVLVTGLVVSTLSSSDPDDPTLTDTGCVRRITLTTNPGWAADAYRGKFVRGTAGTGNGSVYAIAGNGANTIDVVCDTGAFNNTSSIEIIEPSTIIRGAVNVGNSLLRSAVNDISIAPAGTNSPFGSTFFPTAFITFTRCRIDSGITSSVQLNGHSFSNCYVRFGAGCRVGLSFLLPVMQFQYTLFDRFGYFAILQGYLTLNRVCFEGGTSTTLNTLRAANTTTRCSWKRCASGLEISGVPVNSPDGLTRQQLDRWFFYSAGTTVPLLSLNNVGLLYTTSAVGSTFVNGSYGLVMDGNSYWSVGTLTFSGTLRPITLRGASTLRAVGVAGTGNAAYTGINIAEGSRLVYTNAPTLSGTASNYIIDGSAQTQAAVAAGYVGLWLSQAGPAVAVP